MLRGQQFFASPIDHPPKSSERDPVSAEAGNFHIASAWFTSARKVCVVFLRPADSIMRFAFARSRGSALLRPRCARLAALTSRSANLSAQLSTALRERPRVGLAQPA